MSKDNDGDSFGDEAQLNAMGYTQVLHRTWGTFEAFMSAFGGMYFVGGIKILFTTGIYSGGPAALWSSWVITGILMCITAASLAEICSSIPLSGSIYLWAAEAGGKKYGRFFGFVVAFWSTTAWTSFVASTAQATSNFVLSELVVFDAFFPDGVDYTSIKFRAVVWIVSEAFLLLTILSNFMPPRSFTWIFRASLIIMVVDYLLLITYLPISVSKTYGFQSATWVFTEMFNGTGASEGWNWTLSFLSTAYVLTGYDAAGHIAEEVKGASLASARGIFWSCAVSALFGFPLLLVFLFCSPDLETLFDLAAPQPLVLIYDLAFGHGGQIFMTLVAIIGLLINMSIAIVAASRLVSAIARDGILPGSAWIGKVDKNGQPRNAVIFIGIISAILLCTILPSNVAFLSLVSCAGVPTIAAYALIPVLRLVFTRGDFAKAKWSNGRFSTPFCVISAIWNSFVLIVLFSPYTFPVTAQTFNFSCVVFFAVTVMGIVSYFMVDDAVWLSRRSIARVLDVTEGTYVVEKVDEKTVSKDDDVSKEAEMVKEE